MRNKSCSTGGLNNNDNHLDSGGDLMYLNTPVAWFLPLAEQSSGLLNFLLGGFFLLLLLKKRSDEENIRVASESETTSACQKKLVLLGFGVNCEDLYLGGR